MWPNPLRLASPERADGGVAVGQPTQQDANPPPLEHENPGSSDVGETPGTPTPKIAAVEEVDRTPTPGEHITVRSLT